MRFFSKFTKAGFALILSLGFLLVSSQSTLAAEIGSAEHNGIKLTINNYTIKNYGQEMVVYYTIQSKSGQLMEGKSLMNRPDFTIGNKFVQGNDAWYKKVSNQQYQGAVTVQLPQYIPASSNVSFNTDSISSQKGQWTINFEIKK
ncbi:hypothetical protein E2K98_26985 [Bacillus salipaludis]|uniref:DUF4179 domain-containing protein n=1 Tax=Bacillus salipaludis TaxID=2547811 RepID=A0A4R5VJB9_9BACI|nr:hypothetical protein [Bacillus salipaludis]MDQ6595555.1 hypothetical protein [Bacillus salipaludis]TDK56295.1 hypothetical protein E2K98_26985 [Bacillus salipaludis]